MMFIQQQYSDLTIIVNDMNTPQTAAAGNRSAPMPASIKSGNS
jgi:hypothetical protein